MELTKYLSRFNNQKIAVAGDLILDMYISGNASRLSPEAPIPVVLEEEDTYVLGGASNTANNIYTLGGSPFLLGTLGKDYEKKIFLELCKDKIDVHGITISGERPTIRKIRIIANGQQVVRVDREKTFPISKSLETKLLNSLKNISSLNAIILSDYGKGTLTGKLIQDIIGYANEKNIFIFVDPKPKNKFFYKGASLITPNKIETEEMVGFELKNNKLVARAGYQLQEELGCNVLITRGKEGMSLFEKNKKPVHLPTNVQKVYDVSGAGDTVIATIALAKSSGATYLDSAKLSNCTGRIKVTKPRTAPVYKREIKKLLLQNKNV